MHEAALCLALLRLAEAERVRAGAARITALRIRMGALCGVSKDALVRAFPICAHGSSAQGAELRVEDAPGRELLLADLEVI